MRAKDIIDQLPVLRRYARFLCGSITEADALLSAILTDLAEDRRRLDGDLPLREALFKAFHQTWIPVDGPDDDSPDALTDALRDVAPLDRAVLLMVGFEHVPLARAASLIGVSRAEAAARLRRARDLTRFGRRVLIVEDEALAALELERLVLELGYEPLGPAATREEAVAAALTGKPDLIVSDIELDDNGSGIDTIEEIRRVFTVPVVFVTAHPHRLMDRGFSEQTWLVRKPLNRGVLTGFIERALNAP